MPFIDHVDQRMSNTLHKRPIYVHDCFVYQFDRIKNLLLELVFNFVISMIFLVKFFVFVKFMIKEYKVN